MRNRLESLFHEEKEMKKKYCSDMKRLRSLKDEEIDTSDIPELDASFFEKAVISLPKPKANVCIRLDQKRKSRVA